MQDGGPEAVAGATCCAGIGRERPAIVAPARLDLRRKAALRLGTVRGEPRRLLLENPQPVFSASLRMRSEPAVPGCRRVSRLETGNRLVITNQFDRAAPTSKYRSAEWAQLDRRQPWPPSGRQSHAGNPKPPGTNSSDRIFKETHSNPNSKTATGVHRGIGTLFAGPGRRAIAVESVRGR